MSDSLTCQQCALRNPAGFRFCGQCGAPLSPSAGTTAVRPAERIAGIYVTALFGMLAFSSAYFLRTLLPRER